MYRGTYIDTMGRKRREMGYFSLNKPTLNKLHIPVIVQAHYHELPDGRITLGGDVIEVSKEWVLGLQVTGIEARDNNLIIYVDG